MRYFALFVMLFVGIITFGTSPASAQANTETKKYVGKKYVQIKRGDTLSKIAKANNTNYKRLFDANLNIQHPDVIRAGEKVRIPHPKEVLKNRSVAVVQPTAKKVSYNGYKSYKSYKPQSYTRATVSSTGGGAWDRLAACESGGNWSINTGNGYYGGLQFNQATWQSNGGKGYPHQASKAEQIRVAENLRAARGYSPWPACSAKLGL